MGYDAEEKLQQQHPERVHEKTTQLLRTHVLSVVLADPVADRELDPGFGRLYDYEAWLYGCQLQIYGVGTVKHDGMDVSFKFMEWEQWILKHDGMDVGFEFMEWEVQWNTMVVGIWVLNLGGGNSKIIKVNISL